MNSFRLPYRKLNIYRNAFCLLENYVKSSIKTSYSTEAANINDAEQFKAAVLQPKKQNLTIETLVLPEVADNGMVIININRFPIKQKFYF